MDAPQSQDELQEHLAEQISFLESSITSYDAGHTIEAKRLAATLRLLLHDTRRSKSLLGQLGLKNKSFYDSSNYDRYNKTPWDVAVYTGLIGQCINGATNEASYIPILDSRQEPAKWINFDIWWNMVVIKDEVGNTFSRKDLVLTMADQDGGVHVDPVITKKYVEMSRQNSLGWTSFTNPTEQNPLAFPERAAVRQIAHEVRKSLDPHYTKEIDLGGPYFVAYNIVVHYQPFKKKIGRNELCPCGSEKKYKYCHGSV